MDPTTELRDLAKKYQKPFTAKELAMDYNVGKRFKITPQVVGARLSRMSEYIKYKSKYNKTYDRTITYWIRRPKDDKPGNKPPQ